MKFNKKFLLAGIAVSAAISVGAFFATQSQAATDDLDIDAVIIDPIVVTCTTPLNFGSMDAATGGTAVVSTAGVRSATGAVDLVGAGATAGECNVTGDGNLPITVTIADTIVDHTITADTMTVTTFQVDDGTGAGAATAGYAADLTAGDVDLDIGATLNVASGQEPGQYEGIATINVIYQ